jgi:hypothetical protein
MSKLYGFSEYDKYFSLKVSTGLWIIILYLLRPYIVLVASWGIGKRGGGAAGVDGIRNILYPDDLSLTLAILATIPVLLFGYVWSRRKPGAGTMVKKLWANGGKLLVAAAILDIAVVFTPLPGGIASSIHALGWVQVVIAVIIIFYLLGSRRVRDTFADFPVENAQ